MAGRNTSRRWWDADTNLNASEATNRKSGLTSASNTTSTRCAARATRRRGRLPAGRVARRGSAYILVLSVALLVAVIGLTSVAAVRQSLRAAGPRRDADDARLLASSALETGLLVLDNSVATAELNELDWRPNFESGADSAALALGPGTISWAIVDDDGDLADDPSDPFRVVGTGAAGLATYRMSVEMTPTDRGIGLSCLESVLHVDGNITFVTATVDSEATISSNGDVVAAGSTIDAPVEAAGSVLGLSYLSVIQSGADERVMPDGEGVFSEYARRGTEIDVSALPLQTTDGAPMRQLTGLLSPAANPYGPVNADGIYVIDCEGEHLRIVGARIVGTLVIRDPGALSRIEGYVNLEPAIAGYPSLLVDGSLRCRFKTGWLYENAPDPFGEVHNLNPSGTPFLGVTDADTLDVYPSVIKGVVYVGGTLGVDAGHPCFQGAVVVAGTMGANVASLSLVHDPTLIDAAPPGFRPPPNGPPQIVAGSLRREVE